MPDDEALDPTRPPVGEAADGWVRVELDNSGRLVDLELNERVTTLPVAQLRAALIAAFVRAQDVVRGQAEADGSLPSRERLEAVLADAEFAAERRFGEISTVLYDLDRRAGARW